MSKSGRDLDPRKDDTNNIIQRIILLLLIFLLIFISRSRLHRVYTRVQDHIIGLTGLHFKQQQAAGESGYNNAGR
jgi:hypothetical protein